MEYVLIGLAAVALGVAILPFSVQNSIKYKQERIAKKAKSFGVDLDFREN